MLTFKPISVGAYLVCIALSSPLFAALPLAFEPGCYVLKRLPSVSYPAQLQLQKKKQRLLVQGADGKTTELAPDEVYYVRIGPQRYLTVGSFTEPGKDEPVVGPRFVPLLDSGQVMLMQYEYKEARRTAASTPLVHLEGGKIVPSYAPQYPMPEQKSTYLLKSPAAREPTALPADSRRWVGIGFHRALEPHLSSRTDLMQLVYQNQVTENNLSAIIRAFNTNQPYLAVQTSSANK